MTKEKKIFRQLTSSDVCRIYELLHDKGLVSFPITQDARDKIEGLVASVSGSYFGHVSYDTDEAKVVAYLYLLIKDHPFVDGNKRTASLAFEVVCEMNDLDPNYADFGLDALAVFIEKIKEDDHHAVIRQLAEIIFVR